MKTVFTTKDLARKSKVQSFEDAFHQITGFPVGISVATGVAFDATLKSAQLGKIQVLGGSHRGVTAEITAATARKHDLGDMLELSIQTRGVTKISQGDRDVILRPGDMSVLTWQQTRYETSDDCEFLQLWVPRREIEASLGSANLFSTLNISGELGSTSLVRSYFADLIKVHGSLDASVKDRLVTAGLDLITASIAERLAREPPKSMQAGLLMMRAKAFVEQNLSDPTLDPAQLAAALGISLRWLQILFRDHGYYVSDWIWARRLKRAGQYLCDRAMAHLQIGQLAYDCGFVNQAHFSRRFRDHFGLTPRDFRQRCLDAAP